MGNTCGSCSFDNRGSEFDMQPKDRLNAVTPTHNNPNVMKEGDPNVLANNVPTKQKEVIETKTGSAPTFDVETKENNFVAQYQAPEQKPVVHQEVHHEKEALGNFHALICSCSSQC